MANKEHVLYFEKSLRTAVILGVVPEICVYIFGMQADDLQQVA